MVFEEPEGFLDETQLAEGEYENSKRAWREVGAVERLEKGGKESEGFAGVLEVLFGEEGGFSDGVGGREDVDDGVSVRGE